jgi:hypothetical protein
MRNRKKPAYLTADQLDKKAAARIVEADKLPPGEARRLAFKNAAQLRTYAEMKRLLSPPGSRASQPT